MVRHDYVRLQVLGWIDKSADSLDLIVELQGSESMSFIDSASAL